MTKCIDIRLAFDELEDKYGEGYTYLELKYVREGDTNLTEGERRGLGETVAQSDYWQLDVWNAIQRVIAGERKVKF